VVQVASPSTKIQVGSRKHRILAFQVGFSCRSQLWTMHGRAMGPSGSGCGAGLGSHSALMVELATLWLILWLNLSQP
jgi:hypothetical protein